MKQEGLRGEGASRIALAALAGAVLFEIGFVLLFTPFVTTDAASHLGSAAALVDSVGTFDLGDRFLEWNRWPVPSVVGNLLLAGLLPVVGVEWSERLVLIAYICALPAATLYAVRAMAPGDVWLAGFAIPMTFTFCFLYGFLNFSYSVVAFLVVAGFVLRSPVVPTSRRTLGLIALLVLAFFCHLVGFGVAWLFVATVLAVRAVMNAAARVVIARHAVAALLPSLALAIAYVAWSDSTGGATWNLSLRKVAGAAALEWGLVTYDRLEAVLALALAGVLGSLVVAAIARRRPWREPMADTAAVGMFTVVAAALAVLAPDVVGSGSFISHRLVLFPVFGALIWLAGQDLRRSHVAAASVAALAVAVGLAVVRYDELRAVERIARDMRPTIDCVQEGATIVQGNLARVSFGSARRIDPLTAEAGRIAAARDGLDLGNVDFLVPQWLQRYSAENDPARHLFPRGFVESTPPPLDFESFEEATGSPVDYVLVWARPMMSDETRRSSEYARFEATLRSRYLHAVRSPEGWWELWVSRARASTRNAGRCG